MSSLVRKFVLVMLAIAIIAGSIGSVSAYTYNRQTAADYAKVNWNTNVPGSWYFQERGGDCTNFVSHSLYAGGWPQRGTQWTPNYRWYFNSIYSYSSSWTSVPEFRNFIINSRRGTEVY
ncbi:amidase domain-containing protein [Patescibacteria group bacterium]|nr:amidase domain-containing protein [Patescibacteria group bacterium]